MLERILKESLVEEVLGDLQEKYQVELKKTDLLRARFNYWIQAINYLRPFALKPVLSPAKSNIMFRHHLKLSLRSLKCDRSTTIIKIGGLSLGLMATIFIALWVYDEISYNRQFEHAPRIAIAMQNQIFGDEIRTWFSQPMHLAPVLREEYRNYFDEVVITSGTRDQQINWQDKKMLLSGAFIEPGIVKMLSLKFNQGSPTALEDISSVIISQSAADALLGDKAPIGQALKLSDEMDVQVAGVYQDLPQNSSFANLHFIAPWELLKKTANYEERLGWGNSWFNIYVMLTEGVSFSEASAAIKNEKKKHISVERAARVRPEIFLHEMKDWYLRSRFKDGQNAGGRISTVWLFGFIGLFILLLATINFINLSTAQSSKKSLEVGIRKTIGSQKNQLVRRFLTESIVVVTISFILAGLLCWWLLPIFNQLTEKQIQFPWTAPEMWLITLFGIAIVSLMAGLYPAFFLTSYSPLTALRKQSADNRASLSIRRVLVVFQFMVAIVLVIGTLVIALQINHTKSRPIGYQQNNIVSIPINNDKIMQHYETIRDQLLKSGHLSEVAASDVTMTATYTTNSGFYWAGKDPNLSEEFNTLRATHGFGKLVGWEIKEGRDFSKSFGTDSLAFILNETAVKYMNLKEPIGKKIQWGENASNGTYEVIGIVKDMITTSPYEAVRPMIRLALWQFHQIYQL